MPNVYECMGVDLNSDRITMAKHNCKVYGIPDKKVKFQNKSIADVDIRGTFWLAPDPMERFKELVMFFDPPWGGLDYQKKEKMSLFEDFKPYPIREALTNAFKWTNNIMLKLPKNTDIDALLAQIATCHMEAYL